MAIMKIISDGSVDGSATEWTSDSEWEDDDALVSDAIIDSSCARHMDDMSRMSPRSMEYIEDDLICHPQPATPAVEASPTSIYTLAWLYDVMIVMVLGNVLLPGPLWSLVACMFTFYCLPSRVEMCKSSGHVFYMGVLIYSNRMVADLDDPCSSSATLSSILESDG